MHSLITRHTLSRMAQARSQRLGEQLYPLYYPEFFHKTVPAGTTSWEEPVAAGGEQFCECARAQALSHTHIYRVYSRTTHHSFLHLSDHRYELQRQRNILANQARAREHAAD